MAWVAFRRLGHFLLPVALAALAVSVADASPPPAHSPAKRSPERTAILDAIRPMISQEAGGNVEFQVLAIRSNGRWAYVYGRAQRPGGAPIGRIAGNQSMQRWASNPFIEAIAEHRGGRWAWTGHMLGRARSGGTIVDMCNFGDGVGPETFVECRRSNNR